MYRQVSTMFLLGPLLVLGLCFGLTSSKSAPVFLWSNQASSPDSSAHFSTLVDQIEPSDLLSGYTTSKIPVVAFVQKDLNVEQFAANDAPYVSTLFDNPQHNPVLFTNVKTPQKIYSSFKNSDSALNENVVIYLPGENLRENNDLIKSHVEKFNASGPVVFMLTGESNQLLKANKRATRQIKDTTAKLLKGSCYLVYATGATVNLVKKDVTTDTKIEFDVPSIVEGDETTCGTTHVAEKVTLKFVSKESGKATLHLTLEFSGANETGWNIKSITADLGTTFDKFVVNRRALLYTSTPTKFSYSCQKATFPLNETTSGYLSSSTITIDTFQVQPFIQGDSSKFLDSSDCAVWFTMPIWTGLIVSLILIAILYFGIVSLNSIITPDRFENPKGRGLIITNVEE